MHVHVPVRRAHQLFRCVVWVLIFVPGVAGLSEIGKNNLALNLYRSLF